MATNAAATVVYTPGPPVTSGPIASVNSERRTSFATNQIHLKTVNGGPMFGIICGCGKTGEIGFQPGVFQGLRSGITSSGFAYRRSTGVAYLGEQALGFLHQGSGFVKKLASGDVISSKAGSFLTGAFANPLAYQFGGLAGLQQNRQASGIGWPANSTGFAGFAFTSINGTHRDYGWVRLTYSVGDNGLANQITAIDWAYDDAGNPINAGQTIDAVPEPSSLALLATGAAAIAMLRRRKRA